MAKSGEDLKREIERFLDENAALKQRKPGPLWPMDLGARWEAELA